MSTLTARLVVQPTCTDDRQVYHEKRFSPVLNRSVQRTKTNHWRVYSTEYMFPSVSFVHQLTLILHEFQSTLAFDDSSLARSRWGDVVRVARLTTGLKPAKALRRKITETNLKNPCERMLACQILSCIVRHFKPSCIYLY